MLFSPSLSRVVIINPQIWGWGLCGHLREHDGWGTGRMLWEVMCSMGPGVGKILEALGARG